MCVYIVSALVCCSFIPRYIPIASSGRDTPVANARPASRKPHFNFETDKTAKKIKFCPALLFCRKRKIFVLYSAKSDDSLIFFRRIPNLQAR